MTIAVSSALRGHVLLALAVLMMVGSSVGATHAQEFRGEKESKPYTHLNFQNDPNNFQFAIIGDHAGGHRTGVLRSAVDLLNLLRPEFVLSVGDFIEGYDKDKKVLEAQWAGVSEKLKALAMPMFFVPGNHDLNFDPSEQVWFERMGSKRSYSHFVYKDVLFLLVSTEDPPKKNPPKELLEKYDQLKTGKITNREEVRKTIAELEEWAGKVNISDAQVSYFKKVLEANQNVRWTLAFMHAPPWSLPELGNFAKIESLLQDRPYTAFAGHTHTYNYTHRKGRDYITMGMTGGAVPGAGGSVGHMDHVAWVTMTDKGPVISNLLLNGILDKRGAVPALQDTLIFRARQITQPGQSLGIKSVPNLRDLGGYTTSDGSTVASGLVYRSNQLYHVSADDMKKLAGLRLKTAFDLRTFDERSSRPGEVPQGVSYSWLDVVADAPQSGPAQLEKLMEDPKKANAELGGGKVEESFEAAYREFVSLPSARLEFRKLFLAMGDRSQLPTLFHCTTGKDRTGWAAAALLTLLGVPEDKVYEDYLRSNEYILPAYKKVIDQFVEKGVDRQIPEAIFGVRKEYLDAAFDEMKKKYGSIEKYFSEGLGIGDEQQRAIRELYLGSS